MIIRYLLLLITVVASVNGQCSGNIKECKNKFKCSSNQNGIYKISECSSLIGYCNNGETKIGECIDGYYFNDISGNCEKPTEDFCSHLILKNSTMVCSDGSLKLYSDYTNFGTEKQSDSRKENDDDTLERSAFSQGETKCNENGLRAIGNCLPVYQICNNEEIEYATCPEGMVFDSRFLACTSQCPIIISQTDKAKQQSPIKSSDYLENDDGYAWRLAETPCDEDGAVALGECLPVYQICTNGEAEFAHCLDDMVFDSRLLACSAKCQVDLTLRNEQTKEDNVLESSLEDDELDNESTNESNVLEGALEEDELDDNAWRLAETLCDEDGAVALGDCLPVYQICKNGEAGISLCPDDMVFDARLLACSSKCLVDITTRNDQIKQTSESNNENPLNEQELDDNAWRLAETSCDEDGGVALGDCLPVYQMCTNGEAQFVRCPDDMVFHSRLLACSSECLVDLTVHNEPKKETSESNIHENPLNEQELDDNAWRLAETSCDEDGAVALGDCLPVYQICVNRKAEFVRCLDDMMFDSRLLACSAKCNVDLSLRNEPTKESNVLESSLEDDELDNESTEENNIIENPLNDNELDDNSWHLAQTSCNDDGAVALGNCLPVYQVCMNGKAEFVRCLDDMLFDSRVLACSSHCLVDISLDQPTQSSNYPYNEQTRGYYESTKIPEVQTTRSSYDEITTSMKTAYPRYKATPPLLPRTPNNRIYEETKYTPTSASTVNYHRSTANYDASTVNYESSTGYYDPSTPKYGSSTGNYYSSTVDYDRSTPYYESSTGNYDPSTVNYEFATANYDSLTPNYESSTVNYDPLLVDDDSSTANHDFSMASTEFNFVQTTTQYTPVIQKDKSEFVDDSFVKNRDENVRIIVNNNVRDSFNGKKSKKPLYTPFVRSGLSNKMKFDGFNRGKRPEKPAISPFLKGGEKVQRFDDGFTGKFSQLPVYNPFEHFNGVNKNKRTGRRKHKKPRRNSRKNKNKEENEIKEFNEELLDSNNVEDLKEQQGTYSVEDIPDNLWRSKRSILSNVKCWVTFDYYKPQSPFIELFSQKISKTDPECLHRKDGYQFSSGICRKNYYTCEEGSAILKSCTREGLVYSDVANRCVSKSELVECNPVEMIENDEPKIEEKKDLDGFCSGQKDGFYKHPTECQRILQCFGETLIEHEPCEHNLAFDERRGICDYRRNVPGCGSTDIQNDDNSESGCNGHEHGEHVPNKENCSTYYRCVWNRLELMSCPDETVFNPELSVCDYPSQVPSCSL